MANEPTMLENIIEVLRKMDELELARALVKILELERGIDNG